MALFTLFVEDDFTLSDSVWKILPCLWKMNLPCLVDM